MATEQSTIQRFDAIVLGTGQAGLPLARRLAAAGMTNGQDRSLVRVIDVIGRRFPGACCHHVQPIRNRNTKLLRRSARRGPRITTEV